MALVAYTRAHTHTHTHTHAHTHTHTHTHACIHLRIESDFKKPGVWLACAWFKNLKNPGVSFGHSMHLKMYIKNMPFY